MSDISTTLRQALAGRYRIERELGRGGMGAVLLAHDLKLDRPVAIKVLPPEMAANPDLRERFLRETRTAAGFSHPNVVPVFAVEEYEGLICFMMDFVEGETLTQKVHRGGPLTAGDLVRVLQEVAWALSYAHSRGVVHRDVKPDNILIEKATGRALVTDFGIARSTAASGLTRVGEVVGTPHYMSPEQAAGDAIDGRSDIYSLGVVGFFAATGRVPFDAETTQSIMAMHLTRPAPPIAALRVDLPPALCALLDRCLAKEPAGRFLSGEQLVESLNALRIAQPQVAPIIRVFLNHANQSVIILVLILVFSRYVKFGAGNVDTAVRVAATIALLWGVVAQLVRQARTLLMQGFSYDDVRAGAGTVWAEDETARAQLRANARVIKLRNRRLLASVGLFVFGAGQIWYLMTYGRKQTGPDNYVITIAQALTILACTVLIGLTVVTIAADPLRKPLFRRIMTAAWAGAPGRAFFRLAGFRIEKVSIATLATTNSTKDASGALTVFFGLESGIQRKLRSLRPLLQRLGQDTLSLDKRLADLDASLTLAGQTSAGDATVLADRREALTAEIETARTNVREARRTATETLEHIRLLLVRLRSGLGTADEVEAELKGIAVKG